MNRVLGVVSCVLLGALLVTGCGKQEQPAPTVSKPGTVLTPTVPPVPPVPPKAAVNVKAEIEKALALAKSGNYAEALAALQRLLNQDITADQKVSINDAIAQIQKWAAEAAASKAGADVTKGLPKSLPMK